MNTAYDTFAQAMDSIEQLHSEGYTSFKLYRDCGFWYINY